MNVLVGHFDVLGLQVQNWLAIIVLLVVVIILRVLTLPENSAPAASLWAGLADPIVVERVGKWLTPAMAFGTKINRSSYPKAMWSALALAVVIVLVSAILTLTPRPGLTISSARFVDSKADVVSCEPLGLRPDGKTDGVIEFAYELAKTPFFAARPREIRLRLERTNPAGIYETGKIFHIVAIAETPGGRSLNERDGRYFGGTVNRLFAHFCRDGRDGPASVYRLSLDDRSIEVLKAAER